LREVGFDNVWNMAGGIKAWQGLVAEGEPESGIPYFTAAASPEELIALAWLLEEGSRTFYSSLSSLPGDNERRNIFLDLTAAEEHHKESLLRLYASLSGKEPDSSFPRSLLGAEPDEDVMEGGMRMRDALRWIEGKQTERMLEISMAIETNSYDLYLKMHQRMQDENAKEVFFRLAREEKQHLAKLTAFLDTMLQAG
jgi:sulfur-carrier protein adenylyltransferase/sulfurtransferase